MYLESSKRLSMTLKSFYQVFIYETQAELQKENWSLYRLEYGTYKEVEDTLYLLMNMYTDDCVGMIIKGE
jgi:hypothetical protein